MDQIVARRLQFDRFTLDLTRGCVRVGGREIDLPPKAFDVLRLLAENAGRLVSKQELYDAVWPGVTVTDESLVQRIRELRQVLGDDDHSLIKTVSRRGYLLDATPQVSAPGTAAGESVPVASGSIVTDKVVSDGGLVRQRWLVGGSTILLLAALVVAATWVAWPRIGPQRDDLAVADADRRVSLVILPFKNVSGDPEQEYFADGITDDLTDSMSWLPGKLVARNTAFAYKGKPVDVREAGRELGVRYVLEGTVDRSGDQVRVTARLIDASRSANIWAEAFDIDRHDLSRLREDVTARLARSLNVELVYAQAERSLRERPRDPEAVDFLRRADALWARTPRGRDVSEPRRLYREALQRDPSLARAWVGLALTYIRNVRLSPTHQQDLLEANAAAERAIALDPRWAQSHLVMGWVLYERKRIDQALASFEHAAQLNANESWAHASVAAANIALGRPENALEPLRKAMRLSPRDPHLSNWQMFMGAASLHLQRDGEAMDWLNKSVALNPSDPFTHMFLASALALSGREAGAKAQLAELLRLKPEFTLSHFKAVETSDVPAFRAQRERIYEGLRRAGVPE
jgi:TolB-like protein/DNA-binding winged helix-turn-helix (wHTH) protein/thioredoxin-like negative regulator of GroEL